MPSSDLTLATRHAYGADLHGGKTLMHTHLRKKVDFRAQDIFQRVECLPCTYKVFGFDHQHQIKLGTVVHTCNPSTHRVEANRVQGYPWLLLQFEVSFSNVRLSQKIIKVSLGYIMSSRLLLPVSASRK